MKNLKLFFSFSKGHLIFNKKSLFSQGAPEKQPAKNIPFDRPTKLPLDNFEIQKTGDFYDIKKGLKRPTEDIFNFNEPVLDKKQ